ncbi:hypothetical protein [uncultured Methanobrevibacter sp.]|uniref:hypothetical protein n=1 Tax=uncultured Methanobrevibacter sp. TaxID=253161 RepID=UPI00261A67D2|nr:hypothetical protein [uncultured Methanobrevibacter sp.]
MRCPNCGNELDEDNYCYACMEFITGEGDDFNDGFNEEHDYDSRVNNGEEICLNCTYWSVNPHGSAYGMVCRRGNFTQGPGDSCFDFVKETHFASYGDDGQYQFDETGRAISNKLYYWKNSR